MIRRMKTATKISLFVTLMLLQKQTKAQTDTTRFVMQVVFVQYDASSSDDGITLKWTTILETNLGSYVIERSNGDENFTAIGKIIAKGSNNVSVPYSFTDKNPMSAALLNCPRTLNVLRWSPISSNPPDMSAFSLATADSISLKVILATCIL